MRIDKLVLQKNICDPKTLSSSTNTITSGHLERTVENYDLYWVGDTFYVVRDGNVAVVMPQGTGYLRGPEGVKKATELAKRFPRPTVDAPASASTS